MIHYRKHTIIYSAGFWYVTRKGKNGSVKNETLTEAKSFIDERCSRGLGKKNKISRGSRYYT